MDVKTFISKNKIKLSPKALNLCQEAIERMKSGHDGLHNEKHVFRLLDNLDQFLKEETTIDKSKINFEVLLISLCWHDVWEATLLPNNIFLILFDMVFEGIGSMLKFAKRAKEVGLSKEITKEVKYAIRKHVRIKILPIKTLEAKILKDMDILDLWS